MRGGEASAGAATQSSPARGGGVAGGDGPAGSGNQRLGLKAEEPSKSGVGFVGIRLRSKKSDTPEKTAFFAARGEEGGGRRDEAGEGQEAATVDEVMAVLSKHSKVAVELLRQASEDLAPASPHATGAAALEVPSSTPLSPSSRKAFAKASLRFDGATAESETEHPPPTPAAARSHAGEDKLKASTARPSSPDDVRPPHDGDAGSSAAGDAAARPGAPSGAFAASLRSRLTATSDSSPAKARGPQQRTPPAPSSAPSVSSDSAAGLHIMAAAPRQQDESDAVGADDTGSLEGDIGEDAGEGSSREVEALDVSAQWESLADL